MIPVNLPTLFFIYLAVFLAGIFSVWIAWEMGKRYREKTAVRGRTQCALCGLVYRVSPGGKSAPPTPCPRCGTPNEITPPATI